MKPFIYIKVGTDWNEVNVKSFKNDISELSNIIFDESDMVNFDEIPGFEPWTFRVYQRATTALS